jgi:hypothetical protein
MFLSSPWFSESGTAADFFVDPAAVTAILEAERRDSSGILHRVAVLTLSTGPETEVEDPERMVREVTAQAKTTP